MKKKPSILMKKKELFFMILFVSLLIGLMGRIFYIQYFKAEYYQKMAYEQQTRDRLIAPNRGKIYDRNMVPVAINETVASISVINAQIKDSEKIAEILSEKLEMNYDDVLKKIKKKVALERIKIKVEKELADEIRALNLPGVVVDEDVKRVYPFNSMASQVVGFVGKDNQGIIGLEAKYDSFLKGKSGKILTETDVIGNELETGEKIRISPENGNDLALTIDVNLQQYAEQALEKAVEAKDAKRGAIIMMNPQNGEILAMANKPDFDLNTPFTINNDEMLEIWDDLPEEDRNQALNQMWRNFSINDTYEPGSTFKIITAAAGMQESILNLNSTFECNGGMQVGGRLIKCWYHPRSHGTQTFLQGIQNSCNPVFMKIGADLGAETFYKYIEKFALKEKTGIDLPGEAGGIFHKLENVGPVELATMSFGQSFQITSLQLLRSASAVVNGGYLVTPHFAKQIIDETGAIVEDIEYPKGEQIINDSVSEDMRHALESVIDTGTGNKTYIAGYRVGGKTATSEKLPRRTGKYIASFLTIAPAENPQIITLVLIDEPKGIYYGGQVAGPIMKEVLSNALPYLNIDVQYKDEELELPEIKEIVLPDFVGKELKDVRKEIEELGLEIDIRGEGNMVVKQFPLENEYVNNGSKIIIYVDNIDNED